MSEVAGRLSAQVGAYYLMKPFGGRGRLMGGVPGVLPAKVLVLGGGIVGYNAALIAQGMQADVTIFERSVDRMRELDVSLGRTVLLQMSSRHADRGGAARGRPGDRRRADPGRQGAAPGHPRDARHDEAGLGAGRRGDRPGRLLRDLAADHALRSDLRGRRRRPLLRREHARARCRSPRPWALTNVTLPVHRGDRRARASAARSPTDPALAKGSTWPTASVTYEPVAEAVGMEYTPL